MYPKFTGDKAVLAGIINTMTKAYPNIDWDLLPEWIQYAASCAWLSNGPPSTEKEMSDLIRYRMVADNKENTMPHMHCEHCEEPYWTSFPDKHDGHLCDSCSDIQQGYTDGFAMAIKLLAEKLDTTIENLHRVLKET